VANGRTPSTKPTPSLRPSCRSQPDEVEADLNEILRDRIAADEDEDEEEDAPAPVPTGGMVERQDTELHCPHCFLLIQAKTVAETGECGHCGGPIT